MRTSPDRAKTCTRLPLAYLARDGLRAVVPGCGDFVGDIAQLAVLLLPGFPQHLERLVFGHLLDCHHDADCGAGPARCDEGEFEVGELVLIDKLVA